MNRKSCFLDGYSPKKVLMGRSLVGISKVNRNAESLHSEVLANVKKAMEVAEWKLYLSRGAIVAIKPNLCIDILFPGFVTSPWVVEGVISTIKGYVGDIYVVESDTWTTDADKAVRESGIHRICQKYGVEWVNMSKGPFEWRRREDNLVLDKEIEIHSLLSRAELISVPVMKTHGNTVMSGAVKNQWGCLRKMRLAYHEVIDEALVDINNLIRPRFSVVDATICCEGKGPKQGKPVICDLVLASGDNVALDAVCCQIMGIEIEKVRHLIMCEKYNTGVADINRIEIVGEKRDNLPNFKFNHGKKSLLTTMDLFFRKPFLKKLIYETFIFKLIVLAAKINYPFWMFFVGNRLRKKVMESRYGEQWLQYKG